MRWRVTPSALKPTCKRRARFREARWPRNPEVRSRRGLLESRFHCADGALARDVRGPGIWASVTVTFFCSPPRTTPSVSEVPGAELLTFLARSLACLMGSPLTDVTSCSSEPPRDQNVDRALQVPVCRVRRLAATPTRCTATGFHV